MDAEHLISVLAGVMRAGRRATSTPPPQTLPLWVLPAAPEPGPGALSTTPGPRAPAGERLAPGSSGVESTLTAPVSAAGVGLLTQRSLVARLSTAGRFTATPRPAAVSPAEELLGDRAPD